MNSPQETEKLTGRGDGVKLLNQKYIMSTKASSKDDSGESTIIEYGKRFLPPMWVDIQEEIERHIEEISHKSKTTIDSFIFS